MVANAGGPMMTLYLLRMHVTTLAFLGTLAWFFLAERAQAYRSASALG